MLNFEKLKTWSKLLSIVSIQTNEIMAASKMGPPPRPTVTILLRRRPMIPDSDPSSNHPGPTSCQPAFSNSPCKRRGVFFFFLSYFFSRLIYPWFLQPSVPCSHIPIEKRHDRKKGQNPCNRRKHSFFSTSGSHHAQRHQLSRGKNRK